jgi:hypothetical protein
MIAALRRRAELKRMAHAQAEALLAEHGADAWQIAYERSRDVGRSDEERALEYRVREVIERRLGMSPRVDTATRYLGD